MHFKCSNPPSFHICSLGDSQARDSMLCSWQSPATKTAIRWLIFCGFRDTVCSRSHTWISLFILYFFYSFSVLIRFALLAYCTNDEITFFHSWKCSLKYALFALFHNLQFDFLFIKILADFSALSFIFPIFSIPIITKGFILQSPIHSLLEIDSRTWSLKGIFQIAFFILYSISKISLFRNPNEECSEQNLSLWSKLRLFSGFLIDF